MTSVQHFGAVGDGVADDTQAVQHAVDQGEGWIELPRGVYRLQRPIEIDLARSGRCGLVGNGGTATLLMTGPGPALRVVGHHQGTAVPSSVLPAVWKQERLPTVSAVEIAGQHPQADGIELVGTMQATLDRVLLRQLRHGVVLRERNRNLLLNACHIYDNAEYGVFFDRCNLHQTIISACHISYNRRAGIRSFGGDLHNLQITGCDIEYNYDEREPGSADVFLETLGDKASEITLASNTIQAVPSAGGCNIRIVGLAEQPPRSAPLISITGNVIGSQETNIELAHANRVTLVGNAIYDGLKRSISARDCRNLVLSANTFGWTAPTDRQMAGGIRLWRCSGVNLSNLTFEDDRAGAAEQGGTIALQECHDVIVGQCQICEPRWRGLWLSDCQRVSVSLNSVVDRRPERQMLAAIELDDQCRDNLIQGNLLRGAVRANLVFPDGTAVSQGNIEQE